MIPPPLAAGPVTLRSWRVDEAPHYLASRDPAVLRFTAEDPGLDAATCRRNIEAARLDPAHAPFAICANDTPVGNLAVVRRGRRAIMSYWLAEEARGRGWASAAVAAAERWAFDTWDIDTVELEIDPANTASIRLAESAGYTRTATRLISACGGPAHVYEMQRPAR